MTPQERDEFLAGPHIAVLSVSRGSGRPPLSVPVFYAYADGELTFFTDTRGRRSAKVPIIERAGVLTLCVQRPEFPYRFATAEGTVTRMDRPAAPEQMLAIARRYFPAKAAEDFVADEFRHPESAPLLIAVRPDRWVTGPPAQ